MAYMKTPLMFDGPTPYNRPQAMAGWGGRGRAVGADEIEMDPDFAGKGANAGVVGQPVPSDRLTAAVESAFSSIASLFGSSPSPTLVHETAHCQGSACAGTVPKFVPPARTPVLDNFGTPAKMVMLAGAAGLAYYFLKKRG